MDLNKEANEQRAADWEARTAETAIRSLRESLTPEMWWAIKYRMVALVACGLAVIIVGIVQGWTGTAVLIATGAVFADSAYWTWYVKRGIDRRFEREKNARIFAESRANAAFKSPPDKLLGPGTRQMPEQPEGGEENGRVRGEVQRPMRSW